MQIWGRRIEGPGRLAAVVPLATQCSGLPSLFAQRLLLIGGPPAMNDAKAAGVCHAPTFHER